MTSKSERLDLRPPLPGQVFDVVVTGQQNRNGRHRFDCTLRSPDFDDHQISRSGPGIDVGGDIAGGSMKFGDRINAT